MLGGGDGRERGAYKLLTPLIIANTAVIGLVVYACTYHFGGYTAGYSILSRD